MCIINKLSNYFNISNKPIIKETFDYLEVIYTSDKLILPSKEQIYEVENCISNSDKFKIYIESDGVEVAKFNSRDSICNFINRLKESIEDDDDENYKIVLSIEKNVIDGNLFIYDFEEFVEYLNKLELKEILFNFNEIIKENNNIFFRIKNNEIFKANTKTIFFLNNDDKVNVDSNFRNTVIDNRNQVATYLNASEYELIADDFIFINESLNDKLNLIFKKLSVIFSLIGICDVSVIDENKLKIILNGYRRIESNLIFTEELNESLTEYIDIYDWIYNEQNNVNNCSDKIGIARNVISASIINNKINNQSEGLFKSICSAHSIYLKENVKEYLDVKSKISEFNFELMQKMSELSKEIGKSLYNNLKVIASFYGTVFVMNILSDKKLDNIFTKDITNLSLVICGFSFIYMIITRFNIKKEIEIFENQYERMKHNYDEILNPEDRENIFKNDKYINEDKKIIKTKVTFYSIIWIVAIIIFLMLIYHLGYLYVCELFNSWIKLIIRH